ncbi:hypothetical protein Cni_G29321 [Canna indica]|uniref:Uncharacterized protein n=1 Tax=Canna indica TaxID=4628 RepID=A0AAQ3L8Y3_9LILI|nr:hypothetical protein Cni_G29321 [Canna indica]
MGIDHITHAPCLDLLDLSSLLTSSLCNPSSLAQFDVSSVATNLLNSSLCSNSNILTQGLQEQQQFPPSSQVHDQLISSCLQTQQLQYPSQLLPTCAPSSNPMVLDEA